jgi:hypothetical protein
LTTCMRLIPQRVHSGGKKEPGCRTISKNRVVSPPPSPHTVHAILDLECPQRSHFKGYIPRNNWEMAGAVIGGHVPEEDMGTSDTSFFAF